MRVFGGYAGEDEVVKQAFDFVQELKDAGETRTFVHTSQLTLFLTIARDEGAFMLLLEGCACIMR